MLRRLRLIKQFHHHTNSWYFGVDRWLIFIGWWAGQSKDQLIGKHEELQNLIALCQPLLPESLYDRFQSRFLSVQSVMTEMQKKTLKRSSKTSKTGQQNTCSCNRIKTSCIYTLLISTFCCSCNHIWVFQILNHVQVELTQMTWTIKINFNCKSEEGLN